MESKSRGSVFLVIVALVLFIILAGCGDDPTKPDQKKEGTIIIEQSPDVLAGAGWTMTGTQNKTGSGDTTLTGMPVGTYTLTWNAVSGYSTPSEDTKTLVADGVITFSGIYTVAQEFVLINAGTFMMGSPTDEYGRRDDENQHTVTLTRSFYMSTTEVTNRQYAELAQWAYEHGYCTATSTSLRDAMDGSTQELLELGDQDCKISFNGGTFTVEVGMEEHPVLEETWYGAVAYCDWLSLNEGLTRAYDHSTWQCNGHDPYSAQGYRLPTEAEWEYACRAGTQTPFNTGNCLDSGTEANYCGSFPYIDCPSGPCGGLEPTDPVGSYPENAYGLFDMHGNLEEWCNDWYGDYSGDVTDPLGPTYGTERVLRGGVFGTHAAGCRSANRYYNYPDLSYYGNGFRPVRSAE